MTASRFVLALVLAIAALTDAPRWVLGAVAATALLTDFVDGRLARATRTTSALGARLDQEADAVLILVLSAIVVADVGWWVLGIGLSRYAFGAAFRLVPPLRTPPARPRPWCRTVAALVGIVLAAVAALPLPHPVATAATSLVAVLLAESFVHEGADRWRAPRAPVAVPWATALAALVVWVALAVPALRHDLSAEVLLRLPLEAVGVLGLALVPWRRIRLALCGTAGLLLGLLVLATVLDVSFERVFDREFDPVGDWSYLGSGVGVLGDSIGTVAATAVAVLGAVVALAVLVGVPLAMVRLVRVTRDHRRPALAGATALALVWGALWATGTRPGSSGAASLTAAEVTLVRANLSDTRSFAKAIGTDPHAARAAADPGGVLAGLAGKDVLLVFVESYGRVAVQGTTYSRGVDRVLDRGTRQLRAAGYSSRSAFLTSPTFGAGSWLAHSSLQSGLWVNSQRRYRQLLGADRMTLTSLFGRAGWRTVFDVPADTRDWPEGKGFYGFQQYYDSRNVGYAGPRFGYAPVPDQYTLEDLRRRELAPARRAPVMAEVDLVSSHHPWTPLPRMVPWAGVGDGSVYAGMPEQGPTSTEVFRDPEAVKRMYGRSVEYSWQALTSFLTTYADPDLVVIALGDHQPHTYVSGADAGHDVPVTVIAQDPAVVRRISGWGWQHGLRPSPHATVWRMDTFRDRFLDAFAR